jgi:hypothetical protein
MGTNFYLTGKRNPLWEGVTNESKVFLLLWHANDHRARYQLMLLRYHLLIQFCNFREEIGQQKMFILSIISVHIRMSTNIYPT